MTKEYTLYNILFEDPTKKIDLRSRLKSSATTPSGKISTNPQSILNGMVASIKNDLNVISKNINVGVLPPSGKLPEEPSQEDLGKAKQAANNISANIDAITQLKNSQLGVAKTEPAIPTVQLEQVIKFAIKNELKKIM